MRESKKFGLSIHFSKIEVMTNIPENFEIKRGQKHIKIVNIYKYLRQTMYFGNRRKNEIKI